MPIAPRVPAGQGELKNQEWVAPQLNTTADGALYFTVRDLAHWAVALNNRRVVGASLIDTAWTPVRLKDGSTYPYGFGWYVLPQRTQPRISHTGSWQGFKTVIARYPKSGLTVIVLANLAEAQVGAIAYGIAGLLQPALQPPHLITRTTGKQPPLPIPAVLGTIVAKPDSAPITPRFRKFLSADWSDWYRALTADGRQWTLGTCDDIAALRLSYLGSSIVYACYAQSARRSGGGTAVSVFYTADWQVAGVEGYGY